MALLVEVAPVDLGRVVVTPVGVEPPAAVVVFKVVVGELPPAPL